MGKSSENLKTVTRVGVDLAKNVFQVHAVDAKGEVLRRGRCGGGAVLAFFVKLPPCVVAMEACSTAHHWGRALIALGHQVKLIPAAHVKPYVRRGKNDAVDAAAISEASMRPGQRFVPVRSVENQAELMRHRAGAVVRVSAGAASTRCAGIWPRSERSPPKARRTPMPSSGRSSAGLDENGEIVVPGADRTSLAPLCEQINALDEAIASDRRADRGRGEGQRAGSADDGDAGHRTAHRPRRSSRGCRTSGSFSSGREFAAYLGLTPRQHSTGGKARLGRITKIGDRYLRKLLVVGATAALVGHAKGHNDACAPVGEGPAGAQPGPKYKFKLTAVALANKLARIGVRGADALLAKITTTGRSRLDDEEALPKQEHFAAKV